MSQLKNLNEVNLNENHNYSNELYQEFMRENADIIHEGVFTPIKKMDTAQVEKRITMSENKLKIIKEKREWWKGLSEAERGQQKIKSFTIAFISGMIAGLLIPITIGGFSISAGVVAGSASIAQSIKLKPHIFQDYEATLNQLEAVYKAQLKQLNERKKELQNSKNESSLLSLESVKIK